MNKVRAIAIFCITAIAISVVVSLTITQALNVAAESVVEAGTITIAITSILKIALHRENKERK